MNRPSFRKMGLSRLGGIVNTSLENLGLQHKISEMKAVAKWKEVVGPQLAAVSMAERVRDGVMFVCCKSSTWSNELSFLKYDIIKRLNKALGKKNVITDIRFSAKGFRRAAEAVQKEERVIKAKTLEAVQVDEEDSKIASELASKAPSEELAMRIQKAVITSKRMEQLKLKEGWKKCSKCSNLHKGASDLCDNCK